MSKKSQIAKLPQIDGLGPRDLARLHKAVRQVWSWSHTWRLAKKRALHSDGFYRCENPKCKQKGKPVPHVAVDHIHPVGEVGGPKYIQRMFVPSRMLQCWCKRCHDAKTRQERAAKTKKENAQLEKVEKKVLSKGSFL